MRNKPKFKVGDKVRVNHETAGAWTGIVTYRAHVGGSEDGTGYYSGWEYEVTNAPEDRSKKYPKEIVYLIPGNRWWPLVWEEEMT